MESVPLGGTMTQQTTAVLRCTGCGTGLDPAATWCWLCHRSTVEVAAAPVAESGPADPSPRARPGMLRSQLSGRVALVVGVLIVLVCTPVATVLLGGGDLGAGAEPATPVGVLVGSEQVDEGDLDRPPGP